MKGGSRYSKSLKRASGFLCANELEKAIDETNKVLSTAPDRPEALCILGLVAFQMGDAGRARSLIERAHELAPDCREYADTLAVVNTRIGKLSEGLYYAKLATALEPNDELTALIPWQFRDYRRVLENPELSSHFINAAVMFDKRDYEKTVEFCNKELRINGDNAACHRLLARTLTRLGRYGEAWRACQAALRVDPDDAEAHQYAGDALIHLGRFEEGRACHRRAVSLAPDDLILRARTMAALAYLPDKMWRDFPAEAGVLRDKIVATAEKVDLSGRDGNVGGRKIRVGYLSDGFCDDARLPFIEAVLKSHDKDRFEVHCYHLTVFEDLFTVGLKGYASRWQHLQDVDDDTAARIMAGDGLDILVDLCSYGDDHRLGVLARRPAPVQVSWLSWPHASRLGAIDYVLSDPVTGEADAGHAAGETCMELEAGLLAFEAKAVALDAARPGESPARRNGFVTFGGVCDLARLNASVAALWSRVLDAVPGARLLLGGVESICPETRARAEELFSRSGVAGRVSFQAAPAETDETVGLAFWSQVDVVLDTFPVCGAAETCEALLAGIPVVTLAGTRRSALIGASILRSAGREEWVAGTEAAFVDKAAALAADAGRLGALRRTLGDGVAASRLCDCAGFTRALENAYERMLAGNVARPKAGKGKRGRGRKGRNGAGAPAGP